MFDSGNAGRFGWVCVGLACSLLAGIMLAGCGTDVPSEYMVNVLVAKQDLIPDKAGRRLKEDDLEVSKIPMRLVPQEFQGDIVLEVDKNSVIDLEIKDAVSAGRIMRFSYLRGGAAKAGTALLPAPGYRVVPISVNKETCPPDLRPRFWVDVRVRQAGVPWLLKRVLVKTVNGQAEELAQKREIQSVGLEVREEDAVLLMDFLNTHKDMIVLMTRSPDEPLKPDETHFNKDWDKPPRPAGLATSEPSEQAKINLTRAEITGYLAAALEEFNSIMDRYPTGKEDLKVLKIKPAGEGYDRWIQILDPINNITDAWGRPYRYVCDDKGQKGEHNKDKYDLSSAGPDGVFGTKDDIKNWPADSRPATSRPAPGYRIVPVPVNKETCPPDLRPGFWVDVHVRQPGVPWLLKHVLVKTINGMSTTRAQLRNIESVGLEVQEEDAILLLDFLANSHKEIILVTRSPDEPLKPDETHFNKDWDKPPRAGGD